MLICHNTLWQRRVDVEKLSVYKGRCVEKLRLLYVKV